MASLRDEDPGLHEWLQRASAHRLLTGPEERALARRARAGDEGARHELYLCNIRLVVSIARKYRNRGLSLADLIQEGALGLDRATRKFDPGRQIRFTTYATWWVWQGIQRSLTNTTTTIRLPSQVADHRNKVRAAVARNPETKLSDLAEELGIPIEDLERAAEAAEVVTSLDREVSVEGDYAHTLLDTLPDMHGVIPGEEIPEEFEGLHDALADLSPIQRDVIKLRFGFGGGIPLNLTEVADRLGKSTTTVQSAQRDGLRRLREALLE